MSPRDLLLTFNAVKAALAAQARAPDDGAAALRLKEAHPWGPEPTPAKPD